MTIDSAMLDRITAKVMQRIFCPAIMLEASGRHCHLSRNAVDALFGKDYQLTKAADLSQPGQFVSRERVRAAGPKGTFENVVVLGPERPECQLEISLTDAIGLGLKVPVRLSGDIGLSPGVRLIGPRGEITITQGVIAAKRHIHMTPEDARRHGLRDGQKVSVQVGGERGVTFHQVILRVSPDFATFMHIDYDEANACGFKKGMLGTIIPPDLPPECNPLEVNFVGY